MSEPQPITVRIKKNPDGRTSLSCTRADGTTTWQRQEGGQAAFFPRHDLTHYAVETVLRHSRGFYGLVAAGWDLSDFGTPWPRGRLPVEANLTEMIVGFFDLERSSGERGLADDLNEVIASFCRENSMPAPDALTDADLDQVRRKRSEVFARWEAVKPGDFIELPFAPGF
jgi:hypothetical protein